MTDEPLEGSGDPYARAGLDRWVAKKWVVISFGNGAPTMKWPDEAARTTRSTGKNTRRRPARNFPICPRPRMLHRRC